MEVRRGSNCRAVVVVTAAIGLSSRPPVLVLRPVIAVPDERPDRDPADFERHLLEVDLDGLVLGGRASSRRYRFRVTSSPIRSIASS